MEPEYKTPLERAVFLLCAVTVTGQQQNTLDTGLGKSLLNWYEVMTSPQASNHMRNSADNELVRYLTELFETNYDESKNIRNYLASQLKIIPF